MFILFKVFYHTKSRIIGETGMERTFEAMPHPGLFSKFGKLKSYLFWRKISVSKIMGHHL